MAGFNLARKNKMLQEHKLAKNLNALNERAVTKEEDKKGSNKPSQEGFDLSFTPGKTYNLDEIILNKDRQTDEVPLIMEVVEGEEINSTDGALAISKDGSKKIVPNQNDYKKYLLD